MRRGVGSRISMVSPQARRTVTEASGRGCRAASTLIQKENDRASTMLGGFGHGSVMPVVTPRNGALTLPRNRGIERFCMAVHPAGHR